eukprot:150504_1
MGAACGCCGSNNDVIDVINIEKRSMISNTLSYQSYHQFDDDEGKINNHDEYESDTLVPRPLPLTDIGTVPPDSEWVEGHIVINNGIEWIQYYGILYGSTLNFYKEKPTISDIMRHKSIYNMINISQFYDIAEFKMDTTDDTVNVNGNIYEYGITFADHCGQFGAEHFLFDIKQERHEWYKRLKLLMVIDQNVIEKHKKMKTMKRSQCKCITQCGWILYGKDDLFWVELMENSTELLLYQDNRNEKDKTVLRSIDLLQHERVKCVDSPDKNTLFRYGLKIDGVALYCISINERAKWVTHCDYIIKQVTVETEK